MQQFGEGILANLNYFDRKFHELKRWVANDPARIDWLVRNSPEARRVIRPARSNTLRCLEMAGGLIAKGLASSMTGA